MSILSKIINSDFSGHTFYVDTAEVSDLPAFVDTGTFNKFYVVRNFDAKGVIFMYLGKGNKQAPKEIVVWYAKHGGFWSRYGNNIKEAIEGAQRDGWLDA